MAYKLIGVWVATVYNIDWPKSIDNIEKQKEEFINILEKMKELNINTIYVQIRPESDALYKSVRNPWSKYLTGIQGENPGYDPLSFMICESHKRSIKFHAWLNPYRITTNGTDLNKLCENHPARLNPDWILEYENSLFYNPENKEVQAYIQETIYEIINNYWVDGIHFDDYFYPYNYPLPEGECKDCNVGNLRREVINELIRQSYKTVKSVNRNISFGVSPFGIWKNNSSDPNGSETTNLESYYSIYADTLTWVYEEVLDYIAPQIYFTIKQLGSEYEKIVKWWSNIISEREVDLYIGQGIYKDEIKNEIELQLNINKKFKNINGSIFFSWSNIVNNKEIEEVIKNI